MRNGKIAQLPMDLRELVNRMMDEGAQSRSIINELEKQRHRWPDGMADINEENVSNWRTGGYMDWVREREVKADVEARREFALRLMGEEGNVNEAVVQIGVTQLYHVLSLLDREGMQKAMQDNPMAFARMVNSLSRLSRNALDMQKYRNHVQERKERIEAELSKATVPGGLTPEGLAAIQKELKLL